MEKKGHNPLEQNELRTEWQFSAFSVLLQREAHCLCIIIRMDLRSLKCERLFNLSHSFFKSLSSICYIVLSFSFRFRDNETVEEVVLYGKKASLLCGFQNQPELKSWNE